ncbi:MAG: TfoX/Sxy family protein [Lentimicrobiaceae bacterium]|nr:TfoX/Sxy family protein [Lentimicrobiaceae bacterium]MCB9024523.1 TfoX/Sxy family protein [Lentimicrobiaceae bacterium]
MNLNELPNIGPGLVKKLKQVGIETAEDLAQTGAEQAFIRLDALDHTVCINTLMALEGALKGIRWHQLQASDKQMLRLFFQQVKAGHTSNAE